MWESEREQEVLGWRAASEVSESCLHARERTFVLHTSLFVSLKREKLGSWEGDLVSIRISRHVVYTRASAGGFLSSFLKLHFQVVLDLQKGWEKATVI